MQKLIAVLFGLLPLCAHSQARIVLNGAKLRLHGGAALVVANGAPNAITRISGHIISEGENNRVQWAAGTTTGTYTVPFGHGASDYLPLSFTKGSGTGSGHMTFSTYATGWKNSDALPAEVGNVRSGQADNSVYMLDRFWGIRAEGYTAKPALTDLIFTYRDAEHDAASGNQIVESALQAQRWNSTLNTWDDYAPQGVVHTSANTVTVSAVAAGDLHPWWVLVDKFHPVPLRWLRFEAAARARVAQLQWRTAEAVDNDFFTVERSGDGVRFTAVGRVEAEEGSGTHSYSYTDAAPLAGTSFYRIRQTDLDGKSTYSVIRTVWFGGQGAGLHVYPSPAARGTAVSAVLPGKAAAAGWAEVRDGSGRTVLRQAYAAGATSLSLVLPSGLSAGVYYVHAEGGTATLLVR